MPDDTLPPAIRPEIIEAAHAKIATIKTRLDAAHTKQVQAMVDATSADQAVTDAIERAAADGSDPDPAVVTTLQHAQATAEMNLRLVQRLEELHGEAVNGLKAAQHHAHIGMYRRGVQSRIDAAAKIEAGLSMALSGKREHDAATATIHKARQLGVQHPVFGGGSLSINMPAPSIEQTTEESERAFWESRGALSGDWPYTPDDRLVRKEPGGLEVAI